MDCLRKRFVVLVILSLVLVPFLSSPVFADYTSIALSPASGFIYADSTAISVSVNSGSDEFVGVDVNLAFTGAVSYLSATGASRCSSFKVTQGTGTINIECLSTAHEEGQAYNGVVATLYFKSTGTGSSVFTFSSTDPNITSKTGGTYTLSTANNPNGTGGTLPDSGLFDDARSVIVGGTVLILFGLFFNQISAVAYSFLGKMKEQKVVYEVRKTEKRRGRLEKKF